MKNPFIILSGTNGRTIRVNVTHIVTYDQRRLESPDRLSPQLWYTYIVITGGNAITRAVEETPEQIDAMIAQCYN